CRSSLRSFRFQPAGPAAAARPAGRRRERPDAPGLRDTLSEDVDLPPRWCVTRGMTSILVLCALVTPVSPTDILKRSEQQLGSRSVYFQYHPNDRVARSDDRTLAPYFHIAGAENETDRLPLKETSAEVSIA